MRAFTAIDIPEGVKGRIGSVASEFHAQNVTLVSQEQLHITLHFLGEVREGKVDILEKSMGQHNFSRFNVSIKGLSYFSPGRPRVIFADVAENAVRISEIYATLADAFIKAGLYLRHEPYVPHITLARVKDRADAVWLLGQIKKYANHEFGSFEVGSVVLRKSVLTGAGPQYEDLYKLKF